MSQCLAAAISCFLVVIVGQQMDKDGNFILEAWGFDNGLHFLAGLDSAAHDIADAGRPERS